MEKILKNIHWAIIGFALFNIGMFWNTSNEKITELHTQQETQRQQYATALKTKKDIATFYKDINEAKSKIEKVAKEIEKTQQLLPSEISDVENISLLRKIAEDVNIKELSLMPDSEDDRGFYLARKYKFKAKATYLQFLIMFEKIAENKRILNISALTFAKLEQAQRSKFQLINGEFTLEAYRYNSKFKEDRGIDNIEKAFVDGVAVDSDNTEAQPKKPKRAKKEKTDKVDE